MNTRLILTMLVLFLATNSFSQENTAEKSMVYLGVGYPSHGDMTIRKNSFLASFGYRYEFAKNFAAEVFILHSSANSKLSFFNDKEAVIEYVNTENIGLGFLDWSQISTFATGVKLHWFLLNKTKHKLSFNFGGGYYIASSSIQSFQETVIDVETEMVIDVVQREGSNKRQKPFIIPGFTYNFQVYKTFGVGLEATAFFEQGSEGLITDVPVLSDFYALSFIITQKF